MADHYDDNIDFKRNSNHAQDGEEGGVKLNEKAGEYMRELLSEKVKLSSDKFPVSLKLLDQEVTRLQSSGRLPKDSKYVDVFNEKPAKVSVKVLVPVKAYPKFNFVGKLLGPKGNTMKQLQEETMTKMAVLGRGSMRDKQKEEELRNSLDPKYSHLADDLHVEISAMGPPAEAYARIAYALAEIKKYLVPDNVDMMGGPPPNLMMERGVRPGPPGRLPPRMPPAPMPPPMPRPMPGGKSKVMSILDRARTAMESYPPGGFDDPYAPEPLVRGPPRAPEPDFYYDRPQEHYYEDENYFKEEPVQYKASARDVGTRRPGGPAARTYTQQTRPGPYGRPKPGGAGKRRPQ